MQFGLLCGLVVVFRLLHRLVVVLVVGLIIMWVGGLGYYMGW